METKELIEKLEDIITYDNYSDDIRCQAVERLRELSQAQQWRPIEEAPKDGTWIRGYNAVTGGDGEYYRARYVEEVGWKGWEDENTCPCYPTQFKPDDLPPAPQGGEG